MDTIAAIATATGGAVGIVRISGSSVKNLMLSMLGKHLPPRTASLCGFIDPTSGEPIDQGLALFFPAPYSYTGEDVLELQGHGGSIVLEQVLQCCLSQGCRLAEAGEFTRRAYLNDRIDLLQAEGVADLISATSKQATRAALRSLSGRFSLQIHLWQKQLTEIRVRVEALIDFPEEDILSLDTLLIKPPLLSILAEMEQMYKKAQQGQRLRQGLNVVLAGPPNVGKSSLLNALADADIAIVSPEAGTTRDRIETGIQIKGQIITLVDTAGLRTETKDMIEQMGMERTRQSLQMADLVLWITLPYIPSLHTTAEYADEYQSPNQYIPDGIFYLRVYNKADLLDHIPSTETGESGIIHVSAKTGYGLDALRDAILSTTGLTDLGEDTLLARKRHLKSLYEARQSLEKALSHWEQQQTLEICAEELRLAQQSLGSLVGMVHSDDLLGEIFSHFCIGK